MPTTLKNEASIVGIGQTEFSKNSGRSELQLACEAVNAAIVDAGLAPGQIDGMVELHDGHDRRGRDRAERRSRRPELFTAARPYGGGAAIGVHSAGRDGRRHRRRRLRVSCTAR